MIRVVLPISTWHHTYLLTYLLTPWSRVLLEKLTVLQLIKKFPTFYGTPKFITVLTSARQLSPSWANSIQSPQPLPTSWRFILILSSHLRLGLPNCLFPSGYPTKTLCTPLPSSIRATCPAHLNIYIYIGNCTFNQWNSRSSLTCFPLEINTVGVRLLASCWRRDKRCKLVYKKLCARTVKRFLSVSKTCAVIEGMPVLLPLASMFLK